MRGYFSRLKSIIDTCSKEKNRKYESTHRARTSDHLYEDNIVFARFIIKFRDIFYRQLRSDRIEFLKLFGADNRIWCWCNSCYYFQDDFKLKFMD